MQLSNKNYSLLTKLLKVAGEAQGDENGLQNFLKDIKKGPKHAQVENVENSTIDIKEGESSFKTD